MVLGAFLNSSENRRPLVNMLERIVSLHRSATLSFDLLPEELEGRPVKIQVEPL